MLSPDMNMTTLSTRSSRSASASLIPVLRPPLMQLPFEGESYPHFSVDDLTAYYHRWSCSEQAYAWLRGLQQIDYVVIDCETTGSRRYSQVIEVAVLNKQGNLLFHSLLRPSTPIEPIATSIHGLTWRDVKDAPTFDACCDALYQSLQGKLVLAYNAAFDIRLLFQTARAFQIPFPAMETACLMYCYSKMRGEMTPSGQYRRFPLVEACQHMQIAIPLAQLEGKPFAMLRHRAEDDTRLLYELVQCLIKTGGEGVWK
jgi:DNA polymerase-3 subunit epsilon